MKKLITVLLILVMLQLTGCGNGNNEVLDTEQTQDGYEELFASEQPAGQRGGQFGFGIRTNSTEMLKYEYDGKEVHIPYYVENIDKKENADFGLMIFVNGVPQSFNLEYTDGNLAGEAMMHPFVLKPGERQEFDLVFKPQSGKKGERIGFIPVAILKPDYIPDSVEHTGFGSNLHLCCNIPVELKLNADVEEQFTGEAFLKEQDISKEILDEQKNIQHNDTLDSYDSCPKLTLYDLKKKDSDVIEVDKNKVELGVEIYGGEDVSQRITIFANSKPVKVNGKDYISVKTHKGKVYQATVELELDDFRELNSIFAVTMTDGEDYCVQDITQSQAKLLVER